MITEERLQEIEEAPREAMIMKVEARELASAYRERVKGLSVTKGTDGVWLHVESPGGKKASLSMENLGIHRDGLVGQALLEWMDAL